MALINLNIKSFKKDLGGIANRLVDKAVNKVEQKFENAVEDAFAKGLKKVGLSDAIAGYFFWVWAKKPWDMNEVRSYFFERKLTNLLKRKNISMTKINFLVEAKKQIKKKLNPQSDD